MDSAKTSWSDRAYRALLRLFPFDFRGEFESEMEQTFREQRARAARRGRIGLFRLWWETIAGIFATAPSEHWSMLRQDTRYALRMMRKNRGYTFVAILTLALGIGANTAMFSVIYAVLLKPLPYVNDDQLVVLRQRVENDTAINSGFSAPEIEDYRHQSRSLSDLVEYHSMSFTLFSKDDATRVRSGVVSAGFFRMFGVRPILGRDFQASDDRPGAPAVLLLSYEYWKKNQGGDPDIVGKTFEMNDRVHTVIGVLPPVPQYPNENDVYMPTSACPFRSSPRMIANRSGRMVDVFARLKPGETLAHCNSDLAVIAARLHKQYPADYPKELSFTTTSNSLRSELTHAARPMLFILLGAAACVLLIACANVANLTLARMAGRERELVVRSALGAGKGRLLRQLLTESLLLGSVAAVAGVVFASQTLNLLIDFVARLTPRAREIHVDGYMLAFALGVAILTSLVSGSVSALYSRDDLADGLKDGIPHTTTGRRRGLARDVLVVCQVAFSFLLLIGAGLMLRSLSKLQNVDPGFVPQRVLAMTVGLNWSKYPENDQQRAIAGRLIEKVAALPGVTSAALASSYPMSNGNVMYGGWKENLGIEGRRFRAGQGPRITSLRIVSPGYFRTLGIALTRGRTFQESDHKDAPFVAVLNQSLARHYWPDSDPIGHRITINDGKDWLTIVGIVSDVKEFGLNREAGDELYIAQAQGPAVAAILVRTAQDGLGLANQLRRAVREVDPQIAIPTVETLEQARSDSLTSPRVMTNLLAIFAALALAIAACGIGAILALTVRQRWNEIGIRIALGAKPAQVIGMILRQGMTLVLLGLVIGLASAWALTRVMKTLLFEVTPTDPTTFAGVSLALAAVAFVSCYLPARRTTRIDPMLALRRE